MKMTIMNPLMSVIGILSGITSLIFSGVIFMDTEMMKKDIGKHHTHNEMAVLNSSILGLTHQKNIVKMTLKRLDIDIQTLFDDLGEANKRVKEQKFHTESLQKSMAVNRNRTKSEIKKTYEKIEDNTVIENLHHNFNSRIIGVENKVENKVENILKFLKNHGKNVTDT